MASPDFFVWKVGDRKQKASIDIEEDFLTGDVLASYRDLYQEFAIGFSGDVKFAVGHEQHVVVENTGIVVGYKGTAAADLPVYRTIGTVVVHEAGAVGKAEVGRTVAGKASYSISLEPDVYLHAFDKALALVVFYPYLFDGCL